MKNLKDTITNICGLVIAIAGAIVMLQEAGVPLPLWLPTASKTAGIISAALISYFVGKNPDGTSKSTNQVTNQNIGN